MTEELEAWARALSWHTAATSKPSDTQLLCASLFKDEDGAPILLTPGQDSIFRAILYRTDPRVQVECYTRYGKSLTIALAVLTLASVKPVRVPIVAGKKDKAQIIQNYVNQHIFDNDFTASRFVRLPGEKDENIRRHRNKSHLTFDIGGGLMSEVFICSAKDALGLGGNVIIEDESAFVEDPDQALIMRMLGDKKDSFLCKVGNPFKRNHFFKSHNDPRYKIIKITGDQGVKEGRITQDFLDEMKPYSFYKVLYDCEFPGADVMTDDGWLYLLRDDEVNMAQTRVLEPTGRRRLGVDVARGGRNFNSWVLRTDNYAKVLEKNHSSDLMAVAARTKELLIEHNVQPSEVYVDDTGVGGGVVDRLKEDGIRVNAVKLGGSAEEPDMVNVRAECYAGSRGLSKWLKSGAKLEPHMDWVPELTEIRFQKNMSSKVVIESKDDMRARGVESPDVADALALTFARKTVKIMANHGGGFGGVKPMLAKAGLLS